MTSTIHTTESLDRHDDDYATLLLNMHDRVFEMDNLHIFTTDASDLYEAYLDGFLPENRQYHTCRTCEKFFHDFGSLAVVDNDTGKLYPLFWDVNGAPDYYKQSIQNVVNRFRRARVNGVFLSSESVYGPPFKGYYTDGDKKGQWLHLHCAMPNDQVFKSMDKTPEQMMAEKAQDYLVLCNSLADYTVPMIQTAMDILNANTLYRNEKVRSTCEWFLKLKTTVVMIKGNERGNILWYAAATAPIGWCHVKNTMLGTLLDDIKDGLSYKEIADRFDRKMRPDVYMRPKAAPSEGNIEQAEKLVAKMGIASAFQRRHAKLEDVQTIWTPAPLVKPSNNEGVFAHLKGRTPSPGERMVIPGGKITWKKFQEVVLPTAQTIWYNIPIAHLRLPLAALVAPVDPESKLIFQWNNRISWYVYKEGSYAGDWNLVRGAKHEVTAVVLQPNMWDENYLPNHGFGVFLTLKGAYDKNAAKCGGGLYPSILRSELHPVRATIEAYSREAKIANPEQSETSGLFCSNVHTNWNVSITVNTHSGSSVDYVIDRWD